MPKWKTDPAAQWHALKKFRDARQRLITTLAAEYPGEREAIQEIMESRPREIWLLDQIRARGITYGFGPTGKSFDELLAQEDPRYLPAGLSAEGLLACRYLRTCKELGGIPESELPSFSIEVPDAQLRIDAPPFQPPPYDAVTDSRETWLARAERDVKKHFSDFLTNAHGQVQRHVKLGALIAPKQHRGPSDRPTNKTDRKRTPPAPMELRLRWAGLHRRKGWSYGDIHIDPKENPGGQYTLDQITTATQRTLDELGERER